MDTTTDLTAMPGETQTPPQENPTLLKFSEWTAKNYDPSKPPGDPMEKYRGYGDYARMALLEQGRWDDKLVGEIDQRLAQRAVQTGDFAADPEAEYQVADILKRPASDDLPLEALHRYAIEQEPQGGPMTQTAAMATALKQDPSLALNPEDYATKLEGALAGVREWATPEVIEKAEQARVDRGEVPAAILPPLVEGGAPRVHVSPDLLAFVSPDGSIDDRSLATHLKSKGTDPQLIPAIREKLSTPPGFTAPIIQIERQQDFTAQLANLVQSRDADGGFALSEDMNAFREYMQENGSPALSPPGTPTDQLKPHDFRFERIREKLRGTPLADLTPQEQQTFLTDFAKREFMPEIDKKNPTAVLQKLSTGEIVAPVNLMLDRAAFDTAINDASVPAEQRERLRIIQKATVEAAAPQIMQTIMESPQGGDEFIAFMESEMDKGRSRGDIVQDWVSKPENYSALGTYTKGIWSSIGEGIWTLALAPAAMLGNEDALKAMQGAIIEDTNRREYAKLFGKDLGVGYDISRVIAPMAVDVGASFLTAGVAAPVITAAKSGVKGALRATVVNSMKAGTRSLVKDFVQGAATRTLVKQGVADGATGVVAKTAAREQVGKMTADQVFRAAGNDIANSLQTGVGYTAAMATGFNRSAGSTYASLSSTLAAETNPDGSAKYTPKEVREISLTHGLVAGTITASVMGAFMAAGAPGAEMVLRRGLTNTQVRRVFSRLGKDVGDVAGADSAAAKAALDGLMKKSVTGILKSPVVGGFIEEGGEEAADTFLNYFNEAYATGSKVSIAEAAHQAWNSFLAGGLAGGTVAGVGTAMKNRQTPDVAVEASIRRARLLDVATKLEATSPQTASVLRKYAATQQTDLPLLASAESDLRKLQAEKPRGTRTKEVIQQEVAAAKANLETLRRTTLPANAPETAPTEASATDSQQPDTQEDVPPGTPEGGMEQAPVEASVGQDAPAEVAREKDLTPENIGNYSMEELQELENKFMGEIEAYAKGNRKVLHSLSKESLDTVRSEIAERTAQARQSVEQEFDTLVGGRPPGEPMQPTPLGDRLRATQRGLREQSPAATATVPTDSLPEGQTGAAPEGAVPDVLTQPELPGTAQPRKRNLAAMRDATADRIDALERDGLDTTRHTALLARIENVLMTEAQEAHARAVTPEGTVRESASPEDIVAIAEAEDVPVSAVVEPETLQRKTSSVPESPLQTGSRTGTQVESESSPNAETNAAASEDAPLAGVEVSLAAMSPQQAREAGIRDRSDESGWFSYSAWRDRDTGYMSEKMEAWGNENPGMAPPKKFVRRGSGIDSRGRPTGGAESAEKARRTRNKKIEMENGEFFMQSVYPKIKADLTPLDALEIARGMPDQYAPQVYEDFGWESSAFGWTHPEVTPHKHAIVQALKNRQPVTSAIRQNALPEGYVKQGELYVYQPESQTEKPTTIPVTSDILTEIPEGYPIDREQAMLVAAASVSPGGLANALNASPTAADAVRALLAAKGVPDVDKIGVADLAVLAQGEIDTDPVIRGLRGDAVPEAPAPVVETWVSPTERSEAASPQKRIEIARQAAQDAIDNLPDTGANKFKKADLRRALKNATTLKQFIDIATAAEAGGSIQFQPGTAVEADLNALGLQEGTEAFLQGVAAKGPKHLRGIAKLLLEVGAGDTRVAIANLPNLEVGGSGVAGFFLPGLNVVTINAAKRGPRGPVDTLVHELLHAATDAAIRNPNAAQAPVVKRLDRVRKSVQKKLTSPADQYATSNLDEFLTHFLTDPDFRDRVSRMTPKSERNWVTVIADFITDLIHHGRARTQAEKASEQIRKDMLALIQTPEPGLNKGRMLNQLSPDAQNVFVFNELTADLYQGRDSATAAEIEAWREANPEKWERLSRMREDVLREMGYDVKAYHGGREFTEFSQNVPGSTLQGAPKYFYFTTSEDNAAFYEDGEIKEGFLDASGFKEFEGQHPPTVADETYIENFREDTEWTGVVVRDVLDGSHYSDIYAVFPDEDGTTQRFKSSAPISPGPKITPDRWADAGSPDIRFQLSEDAFASAEQQFNQQVNEYVTGSWPADEQGRFDELMSFAGQWAATYAGIPVRVESSPQTQSRLALTGADSPFVRVGGATAVGISKLNLTEAGAKRLIANEVNEEVIHYLHHQVVTQRLGEQGSREAPEESIRRDMLLMLRHPDDDARLAFSKMAYEAYLSYYGEQPNPDVAQDPEDFMVDLIMRDDGVGYGLGYEFVRQAVQMRNFGAVSEVLHPTFLERMVQWFRDRLKAIKNFASRTEVFGERFEKDILETEQALRALRGQGGIRFQLSEDAFADAEQQFNQQVDEYVTGNWPADQAGREAAGAEFIRNWIPRYDSLIQREGFGVFVLGQPYGTTRVEGDVFEGSTDRDSFAVVMPDGSIAVSVGADLFSKSPGDETGAKRFLARAVQEELIHGAHLKSIVSRLGEQPNIQQAVMQDLSDTYFDILEGLPGETDFKRPFRDMSASMSTYRRDTTATPERLSSPNVQGFLSADASTRMVAVSELARQGVQLRRSGSITEKEQTWWNTITEWFKERLAAIKRIASAPSTMGRLFERDIREIESLLDQADIRFQLSEDAFTPQFNEEVSKYITGDWSTDPDTRTRQGVEFAQEWANRYGDLADAIQFPLTNADDGVRAYLQDDGRVVLAIAQDGVAGRISEDEFESKRNIATLLTEEFFHAATFKALLSQTGGNSAQALDLLRATYDSLESDAKTSPEIARALALSMSAYGRLITRPTAFMDAQFDDGLTLARGNKVALTGELSRQLFQLERIGETTELGDTDAQRAWLREVLQTVRDSVKDNTMFNDVLSASYGQLDQRGLRFQLSDVLTESSFQPNTIRETAIGFMPEGTDPDSLGLDYAQLAEDVDDLSPVNAENYVRNAVNHELAKEAGRKALADKAPVREDFASDREFEAAQQDFEADVDLLVDVYERITGGSLTSDRLARFKANPTALQRLITFLTEAIKSAYARLTLRYDPATAVEINRMVRELSKAREGFPLSNARGYEWGVKFQRTFPAPELDNEINQYLTGNWPADAEGRAADAKRFAEEWVKRYDALGAEVVFRGRGERGFEDFKSEITKSGGIKVTLGGSQIARDAAESQGEFEAKRRIAVALNEEFFHAAHQIALIESLGQQDDYVAAAANATKELIEEMQTVAATAPEASRGMLASTVAYLDMDIPDSEIQAATPEDGAMLFFLKGRSPLEMPGEILRQILQLRRMGVVSEVRTPKLAELYGNLIEKVAESQGAFGEAFDSILRQTEQQLDQRGIRFQLSDTDAAPAPTAADFDPAVLATIQQALNAPSPGTGFMGFYDNDPMLLASAERPLSDNKFIRWVQERARRDGAFSTVSSKARVNAEALARTSEETIRALATKTRKAMLAEEPDLNLVQTAAGNTAGLLTPEAAEQIKKEFDAEVAIESAEIEDSYAAALDDAEATGNKAKAKEIRAAIRQEIIEATAAADARQSAKVAVAKQEESDKRRKNQLYALAQLQRTAPDTYEAILALRAYVNDFQRMAKSVNTDSPEMQAIIDQSMNIYLVRSYQVHQDPKMIDLIRESNDPEFVEIREATIEFFRPIALKQVELELENNGDYVNELAKKYNGDYAQMRRALEADATEQAFERAVQLFEDFMAGHDQTGAAFGGSSVANEISRYMAKVNVPPPLLKALAENTDPLFNLVNTATSLTRLVVNAKLLNTIAEQNLTLGNYITEAEKISGITFSKSRDVLRDVLSQPGNDGLKADLRSKIRVPYAAALKRTGKPVIDPETDEGINEKIDYALTEFGKGEVTFAELLPELGAGADRLVNDFFIRSTAMSPDIKSRLQPTPGQFRKWVPLVGIGGKNTPKDTLYKPLHGLYASPEQAEAFKAVFRIGSKESRLGAKKTLDGINRFMIGAAGMSLGVMTLGSPGYYVRNLFGGMFMAGAQGINPFNKEMWLNARDFMNGVILPNGTVSPEFQELIAARVVFDGSQLGYLKELFEEVSKDPDRNVRKLMEITGQLDAKATKLAKAGVAGKSALGKLLDKAQQLAEVTEVLPAVLVYSDFVRILREADFGTETEIKQEASRLTKMVMPSQSEASSMVSAFTRTGFGAMFGPFLRFKTEMLRNTFNTPKLAFEWIRSDNPTLKKHGYKKLAAFGVVWGGLTVALPLIVRAIQGITDEEDRTAREALPPYLRNASLLLWKKDDGLSAWNITFMNPWSFSGDPFSRSIDALLSSRQGEVPGVMARFIAQDFLGENIVFGNVLDAMRNRDGDTGNSIYMESDTTTTKRYKQAMHIIEGAYQPRIWTQGERFIESLGRDTSNADFWYTPGGVAFATFAPFKPITLKQDDMERRIFRELRRENNELSQLTSRIFSPAPRSPEEVREDYDARMDAVARQSKKTLDLVKGMIALRGGGRQAELAIKKNMVASGLSKRRTDLLVDRGQYERVVIPEEELQRINQIDPARKAAWLEAVRSYPSRIDIEAK